MRHIPHEYEPYVNAEGTSIQMCNYIMIQRCSYRYTVDIYTEFIIMWHLNVITTISNLRY